MPDAETITENIDMGFPSGTSVYWGDQTQQIKYEGKIIIYDRKLTEN